MNTNKDFENNFGAKVCSTNKLKIIFAGTPEFAASHLQTLIKNNFNIIAVLTQPDKPVGRGKKIQINPVKTVAIANNILVLQPITLKNIEIQKQLTELKPDLIIVVAYGMLLPKAVLTIPASGCINVHASILPRWRGAAPIQYAILNGDEITGITIMQMDAGLDTGNIILQEEIKISTEDTTTTLTAKLTQLGEKLLLNVLNELQTKRTLEKKPQSDNGVTYAHKINKEMAQINWHNSANRIDQLIRAFNPWPMAFTFLDNEKIIIHKVQVINHAHATNASPGKIIALNKDSIDVATGSGVLRLQILQFIGKKPLPVSEILNSKKEWFLTNHVFIN